MAGLCVQAELIKQCLRTARLDGKRAEVGSVDSFQGREMDVVIISCVRSNQQGDIGCLSDHRFPLSLCPMSS
jgi:superfamily I DNA and/or RNA helicase